ncbi:histidine kinase [Saccharopolyspora gloriosae]|uniref:sensor histidine kinase n=1 Tax=Saccharopolyspora gloriosae TaxID=455344 RepID=UPI001FB73753|nr:histidine kinase [Saccharopolyspora gloriosae]
MRGWRRRGATARRGLVLFGLAWAGPVLFAGCVVAIVLISAGLCAPGERLLDRCRAAPNSARRLAEEQGVEADIEYLPVPPVPQPDAEGWYRWDDHLYRRPLLPHYLQRTLRVSADPATTRDMNWMLLSPFVGAPLGLLAVLIGRPALRLHARWTASLLGPPRPQRAWSRTIQQALLDSWRLLVLGLLSVLNLLGAAGLAGTFLLLHAVGAHRLWERIAAGGSALARLNRTVAARWSGVEIPEPYRPQPPPPEPTSDGLYRCGGRLTESPAPAIRHARYVNVLRDPATWRDLAWLGADPIVTAVLLVPLVVLTLWGTQSVWAPFWVWVLETLTEVDVPDSPWQDWFAAHRITTAALGVAAIAAVLALAPPAMRLHGWWARSLLAPTRRAELARRVRRLTETRADAVDAEARELDRIERDLHDGPQARLVALGLKLGAIRVLLDREPGRARDMLDETGDDSRRVLDELRALVRGIRPPVLVERGLADAVRSLALDVELPVEITGTVPGRCPMAVESAAYFAVSELLGNVLKHAEARAVRIELGHSAGVLRISVTDDGCGGADDGGGTGLRGIRRRLGTFDGTLELSSPAGGPTRATMEIPCALSSPKTSSSSETA